MTHNPAALRELLDIPVPKTLHGKQGFRRHAMACAGDRLRFERRAASACKPPTSMARSC